MGCGALGAVSVKVRGALVPPPPPIAWVCAQGLAFLPMLFRLSGAKEKLQGCVRPLCFKAFQWEPPPPPPTVPSTGFLFL